MQDLTIAGIEFSQVLPERYSEGHQCTAGEAGALQQTFAENIRNNLSKQIKAESEKAQAEGRALDLDALTAMVREKAEKYTFGAPRESDPVKAQARDIAVEALKKHHGSKVWLEMSSEDRQAQVAKLIEANPKILEVAQRQVKDSKKLQESLAGI